MEANLQLELCYESAHEYTPELGTGCSSKAKDDV